MVEGRAPPGLVSRAMAHIDGCGVCRSMVAAASDRTSNLETTATIERSSQPTAPGLVANAAVIGSHIDRYVIEGVLGAGGMGFVYTARHVHLGRRVALKLIRPGRPLDEIDLTRFRREANILASIDDPHVVRVYDFGLHEGAPFLAMELLEGCSLAEIANGPPIPRERALKFGLQMLAGLEAVHRAGVVHRDIKPSNVFVVKNRDGSESIKLLDFGVSKHLDEHSLTESGGIVGTPAYMAPEQVLAPDSIGPCTDVYAVSVILYRLLAGTMPYKAGTIEELLRVFAGTVTPTPVAAHVPDIDTAIARAIDMGLARDTSRRHRSVAEFAKALQNKIDEPSTTRAKRSAKSLPAPAEAPIVAEPASTPFHLRFALVAIGVAVVTAAIAIPIAITPPASTSVRTVQIPRAAPIEAPPAATPIEAPPIDRTPIEPLPQPVELAAPGDVVPAPHDVDTAPPTPTPIEARPTPAREPTRDRVRGSRTRPRTTTREPEPTAAPTPTPVGPRRGANGSPIMR